VRVPRFFSPSPLAEGIEVALDADAAQHAAVVLRLPVGAPIVLFDGRGGEHPAELTVVARSGVRARVGTKRDLDRVPSFPVVLAQALAKGERMDLVAQKATELGASRLAPIATARSEVKLDATRAAKRLAHWQGVVRAACEQCGRNRLMEVDAPTSLATWLAAVPADALRLVLAADGAALGTLPRPGPGGVALLVGPEGGLTEVELAAAAASGFQPASLGPRVLRTETAAIAALASVQVLWGGAP